MKIFVYIFKKIIKKLKIEFQLHRHNRYGVGSIDLQIDDRNQNYININYIDNNNKDIEKNTDDIAANFKK